MRDCSELSICVLCLHKFWYFSTTALSLQVHEVVVLLITFQVGRSGAERVYLTGVNWATEGTFRCEVTADDFETVADSRESSVVGKRDKFQFVFSL